MLVDVCVCDLALQIMKSKHSPSLLLHEDSAVTLGHSKRSELAASSSTSSQAIRLCDREEEPPSIRRLTEPIT